jgi:hypothetical protein
MQGVTEQCADCCRQSLGHGGGDIQPISRARARTSQSDEPRSGSRAAALLRLAAVTVGRTETALGAFYYRLSARIGYAKAVTSTARKIAVLFYDTPVLWRTHTKRIETAPSVPAVAGHRRSAERLNNIMESNRHARGVPSLARG